MALQFSKKSRLVGVLVGAALILHFGNHLIKPLIVPERKQDDVNAEIRRKVAEGV